MEVPISSHIPVDIVSNITSLPLQNLTPDIEEYNEHVETEFLQ